MRDKESANGWMAYAKRDYETAKLIKTHQSPPAIEIICYHSQQAVEKSLKAILALVGENIPKTHDIHKLKKSCEKHFARGCRHKFGARLFEPDFSSIEERPTKHS